jgi:hypothetical protein
MTEAKCITIFKEMIKFPHICNEMEPRAKKGVDFEMNGPLSHFDNERTQFIVKCKDCGYNHSIHIPTKDALTIRQFCIDKGVHTSDRFQDLDCYLCEKGKVQWQCYYFPKALIKACKGFFEEEQKYSKAIANKVFP